MKGIVFTEFLEMVEGKFSPELADRIIERAELASDGVYTAVGTYDHVEMVKLVSCLSTETGIDTADLLRSFGGVQCSSGSMFYFQNTLKVQSSRSAFWKKIEDYIHVEVRKLYPEAELPSFHGDSSQPGRPASHLPIHASVRSPWRKV